MRLVELRKKKEKSQAEVARFINVLQVAYSKYETGKSEPSYDILTKLADYFDVSVDYILGRDENLAFIASDKYKDLHAAFTKGIEGLTEQDLQIVLGLINRLNEGKK